MRKTKFGGDRRRKGQENIKKINVAALEKMEEK
jgi:hypothetical protein